MGESWYPIVPARPRTRLSRTSWLACAPVRLRLEHLAAVSAWLSTTSFSASKRSSVLGLLTQVQISDTQRKFLEMGVNCSCFLLSTARCFLGWLAVSGIGKCWLTAEAV